MRQMEGRLLFLVIFLLCTTTISVHVSGGAEVSVREVPNVT